MATDASCLRGSMVERGTGSSDIRCSSLILAPSRRVESQTRWPHDAAEQRQPRQRRQLDHALGRVRPFMQNILAVDGDRPGLRGQYAVEREVVIPDMAGQRWLSELA